MLLLFILFLNMAYGFEASYRTVLKHVYSDGSVDYAALKADPNLAVLSQELRQAKAPTEKDARLAFWINAYNALTLQLIAQNYPLTSIQDLDSGKVWSTRSFHVGGALHTLDEIEHQILRPLQDHRIHAALNCASKGCPPLWNQPFTAHSIHSELDAAMQRWMSHNAYQLKEGQIAISNIFFWFEGDFKAPSDQKYPDYPPAQWGIVHALVHYSSQEPIKEAIQKGWPLQAQPYDWSLNSH